MRGLQGKPWPHVPGLKALLSNERSLFNEEHILITMKDIIMKPQAIKIVPKRPRPVLLPVHL